MSCGANSDRPRTLSEEKSCETVAESEPESEAVADEIIDTAQKSLGSATKGVPDNARIEVLVEMPPNYAAEFKNSLARLPGVKEVKGEVSSANSTEKMSIIVQVTELK